MSTAQNKIAGAPISWGVCEVPGWGYQLPPDRVLTESGRLPGRHRARARGLPSRTNRSDGPRAVPHRFTRSAGSPPLRCFHRPDHDPLRDVIEVLERYAATGARTLVLSADSVLAGYDTRPTLDEQGWATLLTNLDRIDAVAAEHNVRAVLHPHVGTLIENGDEVQRVLEGSSISLCLDTGHLLIGGTDPAELTRQVPHRIAHTHMKDVDLSLARQVQSGRRTYTEAVRDGMYRPLGTGDVDVAAIVGHLRTQGYDGWYVLEQDTILIEEPPGEGPAADVNTSAAYCGG